MNVTKKDLPKSQLELLVELEYKELEPFIAKAAEKISQEVKIDGFRPGKVPMDVLKQKIGEMSILEEAARLAINKKLDEVIKDHVEGQAIGMPKIDITKLAPNNPMEFKVVLSLLPEITLGEYKNLKIKEKKVEVSKEDLEKTLSEVREMRVKETASTKAVKDGDKVLADLQMFLDSVPVEGGQGKDTAIIIGKNYIVPGFDKKLIGAKKSETREFSLPYPKDHHMKNLAGKMVEFKATIKDVFNRELPELNDEFAKGFGLKKIDELNENIKKSIKDQKQKEADQILERKMLEKILEKTKFGELAEDLVNHEVDAMKAEVKQDVEQHGGKFEDYLKSIGKTEDQFTLDLLPEAVKRVKVSLMIREIANKENIKADEKDVEAQINGMKEYYIKQPEMLERFNTPEYKNYVQNIMNSKAVIDKLREWNIVS